MAPATLGGLNVLVVDDDPTVRGLYTTVLRHAGAAVTSSGVATEALALIDLQTPHVVVTDLRMPGHDGIWLLHELKSRLPSVPVIAVTGHVGSAERDGLLRLGFAEVLAKPLPLSDLATTVARVAARRDRSEGPADRTQERT